MDPLIFQKINPIKDFFAFFNKLDISIFNGVNSLAGKNICLDTLAIFFAEYFEYILVFCFLLFLVKNFKKYLPMVIKGFLAALFSRLIIVNIIRWIWPKPRPFIENQVNLLLEKINSSSFPSGHAAFYFAISTVVFLYLKKVYPRPKFWWGIGVLFFFASFLISISRVFTGLHWPSDIIAGALVGIFSGWLIAKIFKKF
jgi:undecaprenyl-diphosphatase